MKHELTLFKDYRPTSFDSKGLGAHDQGDWIVLPVILTRDADTLEQSNFHTALKIMGGKSDTVNVHGFNHWGCGYFDIIVVHPSREAEAQSIYDSLESYPVLSDDDYSERDHEENDRVYRDMLERDFISNIETIFDVYLLPDNDFYSLFSHLMDQENIYFENNWVNVDNVTENITLEDLYRFKISFKCSAEYYDTLNHWEIARSGVVIIDDSTNKPFPLPQHILNALDPRQTKLL